LHHTIARIQLFRVGDTYMNYTGHTYDEQLNPTSNTLPPISNKIYASSLIMADSLIQYFAMTWPVFSYASNDDGLTWLPATDFTWVLNSNHRSRGKLVYKEMYDSTGGGAFLPSFSFDGGVTWIVVDGSLAIEQVSFDNEKMFLLSEPDINGNGEIHLLQSNTSGFPPVFDTYQSSLAGLLCFFYQDGGFYFLKNDGLYFKELNESTPALIQPIAFNTTPYPPANFWEDDMHQYIKLGNALLVKGIYDTQWLLQTSQSNQSLGADMVSVGDALYAIDGYQLMLSLDHGNSWAPELIDCPAYGITKEIGFADEHLFILQQEGLYKVEATYEPTTLISFIDMDANGVFGFGDTILGNLPLSLETVNSFARIGFTGNNGSLKVPSNSFSHALAMGYFSLQGNGQSYPLPATGDTTYIPFWVNSDVSADPHIKALELDNFRPGYSTQAKLVL
jgi:hypothetical protein